MADDALSSLKNRLQKSGLDDPHTVPRRSRASRTPIDDTPETFMGASVGARSATDDEDVSRKSDLPPNSSANPGDDDDEVVSGGRKPRRRRQRAARAGTDVDPNKLTQMMGAMGNIPGVAPNPPPISEEAEEKPAIAIPPEPVIEEPVAEEPAIEIPIVEKTPSPASVVKKTPSPIPEPLMPGDSSSSPASEPKKAPSSPSAPSADAAAVDLLQTEVASLKVKLEEATDRADDYDALCNKLVPDEDAGVRTMAEYIGGLLGKEEELEELREEHATLQEGHKTFKEEHGALQKEHKTLQEEHAALQGEHKVLQEQHSILEKAFEDQKQAYTLLQTSAPGEIDTAKLAEEQEKIIELQNTLVERDDEIGKLRDKLETAEATAAAAPEIPAQGEEDEIIAMAEKELQLMEDLIKEQEQYINDLEKELGSAEIAASPAAEQKEESPQE